jgi:hypothetical protein
MIYLSLDIGPLAELAQELRSSVDKAMQQAVADLSRQAHAHIVEKVNAELHSTRQKYLDALHIEEAEPGVWVISLDKSASWIEEGLPNGFDMLDGLLRSKKARQAKDGSRYTIVPFAHKQAPTSQTPAQKDLTDTIKKELKSRKIPYGKLETKADGTPKLGLLHSFDIMKTPIKTHEGPGQGHGKTGEVRQGNTGIPFLQGVRIYQRKVQDRAGKTSVQRSVMTFRVASSKHRGQKWIHSGLAAKKFIDEAASWALRQWEERMNDQVLVQVSNF